MATFLYRVGRYAFVHRKLLLGVWIVLLLGTGVAAKTLSGPTSTSFSIPGTEAQRAIDTLQARFPQAGATGAAARIVFAAPNGTSLSDAANKTALEAVLTEARSGAQVANVSDPFTTGSVSPDARVAFSQVTFGVPPIELTATDREALLG